MQRYKAAGSYQKAFNVNVKLVKGFGPCLEKAKFNVTHDQIMENDVVIFKFIEYQVTKGKKRHKQHCVDFVNFVPFDKISNAKIINISMNSTLRMMGLPPIDLDNLIQWQTENRISVKFARQTKRIWSNEFVPSFYGLPGTPFIENSKGTLTFVIDGWPFKE